MMNHQEAGWELENLFEALIVGAMSQVATCQEANTEQENQQVEKEMGGRGAAKS